MDIANLLHMTGYRQVPVLVRKHAKLDTTYTFVKRLSLALRSVTSFSRQPLIIICCPGCVDIDDHDGRYSVFFHGIFGLWRSTFRLYVLDLVAVVLGWADRI